MGERIEQPPILQGDEKAQLQQLWSYLYQVSEAMNNNLLSIGGNELTDSERQIMSGILGSGDVNEPNFNEMETLKSLIIKTADFVQTSIQEYRMNILGESVASGQFGQYVRNTALNVVVNPEGITQDFSFEEVVQGLKEFSVNAKNYIKTGLLRTVGVLPVYGVAIGKDVVTFSEDGTETYNDGNKVAELTAEELSFWQNSVKIASYTGNKISFLYNGTEVFYIQAGKIYASGDMEIVSGKKLMIASGAELDIYSGGNMNVKSGGKTTIESGADLDIANGGDLNVKSGGGMEIQSGGNINIKTGGTFTIESDKFGIDVNGNATFGGTLNAAGGTFAGTMSAACITSGTMSADRIKGDTLTLGGSSNNQYGVLRILNDQNQEIGKWNNAGIDAQGKLKSTDWLFDSDGATYSKKINNVTRKMRVGYMTYGSSQPADAGLYFSLDTNNATAELTLATNYLGAAAGRVVLTGTGINKSALYQLGGVSLGKSDQAWVDYFGMNLLAPGNQMSFYARRSSASGARWYMEYDQNGYQYFCSGGASRSYIGNTDAKITYGYFANLWWDTQLNSSSREVKHDIEELPEQGDMIDRLQPVSYVYNNDQEKRKRFGLIWEDTEKVLPEICMEVDGQKGINYMDLIPILLKEIQDLRKRVKELEGGREIC